MILIAGPCVIESREQLLKIGEELSPIASHPDVEFYFKASFDKANRTSLHSYRGPGLKRGLELLGEVKKRFGYRLLTDVHESWQIEPVSEVVDVIQIPAFLCRQTDLLIGAAKSGKIVNIKKGQFMNPTDMRFSVLKVLETRGWEEASYLNSYRAKVWVTERGTTFGYGNLVVDMRSFPTIRQFAPVIFDATHSVQLPGAGGGKSGGDRRFVFPLARGAAAVGVDGFFFETHSNPAEALSDGPNMITPTQLREFLPTLLEISRLVKPTLNLYEGGSN